MPDNYPGPTKTVHSADLQSSCCHHLNATGINRNIRVTVLTSPDSYLARVSGSMSSGSIHLLPQRSPHPQLASLWEGNEPDNPIRTFSRRSHWETGQGTCAFSEGNRKCLRLSKVRNSELFTATAPHGIAEILGPGRCESLGSVLCLALSAP